MSEWICLDCRKREITKYGEQPEPGKHRWQWVLHDYKCPVLLTRQIRNQRFTLTQRIDCESKPA